MASLVTTTPGWVRGPRLGPHSIQRYGTVYIHQAHGKTCVVRRARLRGAWALSVWGCRTRVLRKGVLLCDTYIPHRRLPLGYTSRERPHVSRKHPYRPNPTQRQILHKGCRKRPPPSPSLPPFPRTQPASGGSVRARFGPTPSCAPAACEPL